MNQSRIYLRDITPETLLHTEFVAVGPVSSTKTTSIEKNICQLRTYLCLVILKKFKFSRFVFTPF